MARTKDPQYELNQAFTSRAVFMDSYNKIAPLGFPRATADLLKKFQITHPTLFKNGDCWSIVKHRKRLMDWLILNHGTA